MSSYCFLLDRRNPWIIPYTEEYCLSNKLRISENIIYDSRYASNFDFCFVLGYMDIIDVKKLDKFCKFFVIHESSLPKGRGFAPLIWQILEGKNTIDICLLEMRKEVDSGGILLKSVMIFDGHELYDEIRCIQAKTTFELIDNFLANRENLTTQEQVGESSYYNKRSPNDSELDPDKSIINQFNLLRACDNEKWPAYFKVKDKTYILKIFKKE